MKDRLLAVQLVFWAILVVCCASTLIAWPAPRDSKLVAALHELERLAEGYDQTALEEALAREARGRASLALAPLASEIETPTTGPVTFAPEQPALQGHASVRLEGLGQLETMSRGPVSVPALVPDGEAVTRAFRWRLARQRHDAGFEIRAVSWTPAEVAAEILEAERQVEPAQQALEMVRRERTQADQTLARAERVYEYRRTAKIKYKLVQESARDLAEARRSASEKAKAQEEARVHYQALAQQAQRLARPKKPPHAEGPWAHALIEATVWRQPEGPALEMHFAVPLASHEVPVTPLRNVRLDEARRAGLWPELEDRTVDGAIAYLQSKFSWHNRGVTLAGWTWGGPTILQVLPALPLVLLLMFAARCRRARISYNPFENAGPLPNVGLGKGSLNLAMLIALPLGVSIASIWSLLALGRLPLVALPLGLAVVATATWACREAYDLGSLREEMERTSLPPPALAR